MSASIEDDKIGKGIVDAAFCVHKQLGPGLLERVYETCLAYELGQTSVLPLHILSVVELFSY